MPPDVLEAFQKRMMLFFTGTSRNSSTILRNQKHASEKGDKLVIERLHAIRELAVSMKEALEGGNLDEFGTLLHLSWLNKRSLTENITSSFIDKCYAAAREAGATGGKLTGAGGGGFLMLDCPPEQQVDVTGVLEGLGLRRLDFAFDHEGAQVMWTVSGAKPSARTHWGAMTMPVVLQDQEQLV